MSAMQAEVFEAIRAIDVPEDKALRAAALASAFAKSDDDTAKSFNRRYGAFDKLAAEVAALNMRIVKIERDLALLKWVVGFNSAMLVTLLFRSFTH